MSEDFKKSMNPTVRYIYASMLGKKSYRNWTIVPYKTMVLTEHRERIKFAKHMIDVLKKRTNIDVLKGKAIHDQARK